MSYRRSAGVGGRKSRQRASQGPAADLDGRGHLRLRPSVFAALRDNGMRWRTVFENGNIEATTATVRTDLAVTAWLAFDRSLVISSILGPADGAAGPAGFFHQPALSKK